MIRIKTWIFGNNSPLLGIWSTCQTFIIFIIWSVYKKSYTIVSKTHIVNSSILKNYDLCFYIKNLSMVNQLNIFYINQLSAMINAYSLFQSTPQQRHSINYIIQWSNSSNIILARIYSCSILVVSVPSVIRIPLL